MEFGWRKSLPWTTVFLWNQIFLAIPTNITNSSYLSHLSTTTSTTCKKLDSQQVLFWNFVPLTSEASMADGQLYKIWCVLSISKPQIGHKESVTIPHFRRFFFVGNKLWHALHRNIFLALWIFNCHINCQISLPLVCCELSALETSCLSFAKWSICTPKRKFSCISTLPNLYIFLQIAVMGILLITIASSFVKMAVMRSMFHAPFCILVNEISNYCISC